MTLKVDKIFETDGNEPFVTFVDQRDRLLGVIPHARAHDLSKYDSPVTMQSVGSCTADAATNALENQLNQFGAEYEADLSRLFLYYCSRRYLQMQDVDKGSSNRMTVRALANIGTCLEPLWPYNADSVLQVPSDAAFDKAAAYRIAEYYSVRSAAEITMAISTGMPVVMAYITSFGAHAICAVGYDYDRGPAGEIKFKNSIGTSYGEDGYEWMSIPDVQASMYDAFAFRVDKAKMPYNKWLKNPIVQFFSKIYKWIDDNFLS